MLKQSAMCSSASVRNWLDKKTLGQEHGCGSREVTLPCHVVIYVSRSSAFIKDLKKAYARLIDVTCRALKVFLSVFLKRI